jgi:SAM-dependent methyltransferase
VLEVTNMSAVEVAAANIEQARAWDGEEGAYWASRADHFDWAIGGYHEPLMAAANIGGGDRVLDIGCGTGQTTRDAARAAGWGSAFGVDLSARMIEVARRLAAQQGLTNASFERVDAQVHSFPTAAFDVAMSRTGTMFFGDPTAAFTNIACSVRPGGRLALLVWQDPDRNKWIRALAGALAVGRDVPVPPIGAPGPFAQADPHEARTVLSSAGFDRIDFQGFTAPMRFGASVEDALDFVVGLMGWMLQDLDDTERDRALANLRDTISQHQTESGEVSFESAAWLITAIRG